MSDIKDAQLNNNKGKKGMVDYENQILDIASIGILITRIGDGTILYANKMIAHLLGIPDAKAIIGTPVPDFYWEAKDRQTVLELFRNEGSVTDHDVRARRANGSMIWVAISIQSFTFEGEPVLLSEIVDITERKHAEKEQLASEERFRSLYNNATIGLYRTTPDGRILMINPTGLRLLGFTSFEDLAQRNLEESGFEQEGARKIFREKLERAGALEQESIWTKKDGSPIFVRESSTVSRDDDGNVIYYDGSFEDITARKQAEEALRASEQRYQTIFNASPVMFWLKDTKNNMIQINQAAAVFENVDSKEVSGRSSYDVYPREQAEAFYQDDLEVVRSGKPKLGIVEKHTAPGTGKTSWVETGKVPIQNERGEIVQILAFGMDITERQQVAEELNRLSSAIDQTGDGIALANLNGNVLYANPAWAEMHGYSVNEILGKHLSIFHTQEQLEKEVIPLNEKAMASGVANSEIGHARKDGTTFPTLMTVAVQKDESGAPVGLIGTVRDITESKQAEELLQQSEANLSSALRVAKMGYWEFDIPTQIFTFNDQYYSLLGIDADKVGGYQMSAQTFAQQYVHPEDAAIVGTSIQKALEATDPNFQLQSESRNLRADGSTMWASVWFRIQKDAQGKTVKLYGVSQDINERKQAEEEMRRFQLMVQSSTDFINMSDMNGNMIFLNATGQRMVGIEEKDIPNQAIFNIIPEEYLSIVQEQVLPTLIEKGEWSGELAYRNTKTNTVVDVYASTYMLRNPQTNEPQYLVNISRDITENKKLELEIQQAFERRGYQVQVSTEISQEVASATELGDLFERVVTLTKERLGYYHTQLLRYNITQDAVALVNGYGETGKKMLAAGHKMPMGSGLIGTAAATGETVMRPTLADDPDWQPNPLLPETKGEIAVPIKWQNNVLGVLDVQSDSAGALTEDDRLLLEGLCGQIAIAMRSAELVETIRQNESRLAEALKIARLANWEYDVEKDIFTFNDQFYSLFHSTAEKAGGYQITSARYTELFVYPDDAALVGAEIGKALNSTERVYNTTLDHRISYEDGGIGYITVQLTVERDENGKITRWYGANQDITERKQAEEALQRSEQLMRTVIDSTPDWIFIKDKEHRYRLANKGYANALHIASENFIGKNDLDLGFPEDLVKGNPEKGIRGFWSDDQLVMESNETQIYPDDPATIDGAVHNFHTIKVPLRDADGQAWGVLAFSRDTTERKHAEETLRINESRLAEALEIARLGNWEYDVEKDIFTFNDQFYSIFHTTVEKVGGYQITSAQYTELFVYPDDAPLVGAEIGKALNSTERVYNTNLDHRILYADGGIGHITVAVTVERDEDGKITRFYGVNQEITERKLAEEALESERRLLRTLMSTMLDLVYVKDAEHRFLLASDAVVRSLGAKTSDEVVGKTDFDFHPRELAEQYFADEKSLMESGLPLIDHEESTIDQATGTYRWLSSTKVPLRDNQGNVIGLVGLNRDITDRKQVEDTLRRNEQEMAERLEEISRLYRNMSHDGWKTYRETADLPSGFIFDKEGTKPVESIDLTGGLFANVPMRVLGGEVVGNLAVANDPQRPMSEEDMEFLQQVSDQVALALEGARLSAQTQSALAQTEKLSEAGLLFTRATDLQELVKIAVETLDIPQINRAVLETFNYNSASEVDSMDVIANWWSGTGQEPTATGTRYTSQILPLLGLFLTPNPIFIEDTFTDERIDDISMQVVKKLTIRAVAVLPLFLADRQIGVLLLESEVPHEFNQDEIRLYSAMGPQISTVLENRRQFERAQQQAEREGMLNIISQKIQSATTVEAVLQIAARELGHALGAPMTIAQLSMKDKK